MGVLLTTADGSARVRRRRRRSAASDYVPGFAGLLIPPGATSGTFQVSVNGDTHRGVHRGLHA